MTYIRLDAFTVFGAASDALPTAFQCNKQRLNELVRAAELARSHGDGHLWVTLDDLQLFEAML